jgi:membrane protein YdbS with pleckstrin-like domain
VGLCAATAAAAALVHRVAGAVAPAISVARVGLAMALAIGVGRYWPFAGKLMTIVASGVVVAVYVVLLVVTRELGRHDIEAVRTVLARRRGQP